jgi:hypothetical protein
VPKTGADGAASSNIMLRQCYAQTLHGQFLLSVFPFFLFSFCRDLMFKEYFLLRKYSSTNIFY